MNRRSSIAHRCLAASSLAFVACGSSGDPAGTGGTGGSAGASGAAGAAGAAGGSSTTLVVETVGTNLFGADAEYENDRRPAIVAAIAKNDADVLCLSDVLREEDKQAIADAAKGAFPYAFWGKHGAADQPADPTLEDGTKLPPATTPPCGPKQLAALEDGIACAEMHCSSIPSDPSGHVSTLDCVSSQCATPLLPLIVGGPEERRCASCFEANLTSYASWSEIKKKCETEPTAGFVFDGQTDTMILSRRPLEQAESVVLPSSLFRRDVLHGKHPAGVDVYCAHLQTVFLGTLIVYPGPYAGTMTGPPAWAEENRLEALKLRNLVKARSGTSPAILLGNLESSVASTSGGVAVVDANGGAATLGVLTPTPFVLGVAPGYAPACTECPENPLAQIAAPGMWTHHILLAGIDPTRVVATTRGARDASVSVTTPTGPGMVPLSSHYSLRSTIALP
jgi:hypothetical protein